MSGLKKIAITGPESTGKSILSEQLAQHYKTVWVKEFARYYIDNLRRPYRKEDILIIAKGQIRAEKMKSAEAVKFLFCDTELIVTKIWSEVKYGSCDPWILKKIDQNIYDLFLLCNIDIPWMDDPQREHPEMREHLFDLYYQELTRRNLPFFVISGTGNDRLKNAITVIDEFMVKSFKE